MWELVASGLVLNTLKSEKPVEKRVNNYTLEITNCVEKPLMSYAGSTGVCNDVIYRLPVQRGVASW